MTANHKRTQAPPSPGSDTDAENTSTLTVADHLDSDTQETVEKYDREVRTRTFSARWLTLLVGGFAIALSLYQMATAVVSPPPVLLHRSIHVAAILFLGFALYRFRMKEKGQSIPWFDWILMALSVSTAGYLIIGYEDLTTRGGQTTTLDVVFGAILVLLVLELARRLTGWILPALAIAAILFGLYGRSLPSIFRHRGYDIDQLLAYMYTGLEGVYSTAIGVSATYIFLFILFGAFLSKSGMGQFFNDIALAIAGQTRGGPAKVAVIASGFLGSINGSAIANVVTTGAFTIPLMKKVGYKRNFAGAVEASASVGGQILPPVMGATAFIMAETLGIAYQTIALVAVVPALLYYMGIIAQVHLRATAQGLQGISRENLPAVMSVIKERGHLVLPLIFLIYMLFFSGRTILFSAMLTIVATFIAAQLRKSTRMSFADVLEALRTGATSAVGVAIACACVGIIVGVASITGFGVKLANAIVVLGDGMLLPTLLMTGVACLILGMGLPSIPAYIITATMAAPALTALGVEPLAAHLFVFYFGLFANITPPVALAAFAAAGVSGGEPMRTGFISLKLAIAGFIVPFLFVYNPALLMQNVTVFEAVHVVVTAVVGVLALAVAVEGHLMVSLPWWLRVIFAGGALLTLVPETVTDLVGGGLLLVALVLTAASAKRQGQLSLRAI